MATIVLSAAGAAIGSSIGGGVLGLSSVVIGRAVGATVGRAIDQRIMGGGSDVVESGRVDRFRVMGAGEGRAIARVWGRMRVAGQVIWASRFVERRSQSGGGGKGTSPQPTTVSFSYTVSLAIALCEGEISGIGRIWADGREIAPKDLGLQVYTGSQSQLADPRIEAVEGAGNVPAFRGIAYVVIEDLDLSQFGNRVPQFNFEVKRPVQPQSASAATEELGAAIRAVAMIPGTGEYALATAPVYFQDGLGKHRSANVHSRSGKTDFVTAFEALEDELPNCGSVGLVVSWFGDDLRCDRATLRPKVEQNTVDGKGMAWRVSGLDRQSAQAVPYQDNRPVYGGTPADEAVVQAIRRMRNDRKEVMFYPFILMDQLQGNGLADPWSGAADQPHLPWRGRITLSVAPGQAGSPAQNAAAAAEVAAFFGSAAPGDFVANGDTVDYTGPAEWSYRRFVLHQARLCAVAGGVDAFCIGSEMRGLTQIRSAANAFPAVQALVQLAADVRSILGPTTKIGYAADWSEYFGYQPQDGTGDVLFHLDPLWSDANIDFVGIDNYMPLSDWRDGHAHADAGWGAIHDLGYLQSNIEGGEGFEWYYASKAQADLQIRTPITDGAHGEDWIYRYKDIRSWWHNPHHERIAGQRQAQPTAWLPQSKPVWFTEIGCAAIDKGSNEPNKFLDLKSSESSLPAYSNGRRDDLLQMQFLRAVHDYWRDPARNPVSTVYAGPMIDMDHAHVWAWDARPFPAFPHREAAWSDAANYMRGHWLNGRATACSLAGVVAEICARSGVDAIDTDRLYGLVRGYGIESEGSGRQGLQPLMLAHGFEAIERDGLLTFRNRDGRADTTVAPGELAVREGEAVPLMRLRNAEAEIADRLRLGFIDADADYDARWLEAIMADEGGEMSTGTELPLLLTANEAMAIAERWLSEARVARDQAQFALPPSRFAWGAGDVIEIEGDLWRIDRLSQGLVQDCEAVRVEPEIYEPSDSTDGDVPQRPFEPVVPVSPLFMDLPLLVGDEVPHAAHVAVAADPWPGSVAVYSAPADDGYVLNRLVQQGAIVGTSQTLLPAASPALFDRGVPLRIAVVGGDLASVEEAELFAGANLAAIGDGSADNWEIFQFVDALLIAPGIYELSTRIRGLAGTDALASTEWPAGSIFVLLDGSQSQLDLPLSSRGLARHYRIGPATAGYDDPSYEHVQLAFDGIGLRPLAPVHLAARLQTNGDIVTSWIRRTRIDGDSWQSAEVPLGEESEAYQVRVVQNAAILRSVQVTSPGWTYTLADRTSDGAGASFVIQVAQMSASFGPGLFREVNINV